MGTSGGLSVRLIGENSSRLFPKQLGDCWEMSREDPLQLQSLYRWNPCGFPDHFCVVCDYTPSILLWLSHLSVNEPLPSWNSVCILLQTRQMGLLVDTSPCDLEELLDSVKNFETVNVKDRSGGSSSSCSISVT